MAYVVEEAYNSREWHADGSITFRYYVSGQSDEDAARTALIAALPASYQDREPYDRPEFVPIYLDTTTDVGRWEAEIIYTLPGKKPRPDPYAIGTLQLTFNTGGGTYHRVASHETIDSYSAAGETARDFKGLIGVTTSGAAGVDVPMPVFNLTAVYIWDSDSLPSSDAIYSLTALVNDASYTLTDSETGLSLTFAKGELLLRGVTMAAMRGDGGVPYTYHFEASKNATGLTIGGDRITGIAKEGWQHLWVYYNEEDVTETSVDPKYTVFRPISAYVEKVIKYGDFTALGIHT